MRALFKQRNIWDVIAAQRAELLAGEEQTVRQVLAEWGKTSQYIRALLNEVVARIESARAHNLPVSESWLWQWHRYQQILTTIDDRVHSFGVKSAAAASARSAAALKLGLDHAGQTGAMALPKGSIAFRLINPSVAENALAALNLEGPLAEIFAGYGPNAVATARRVFHEGLTRGVNPRQIARDLMSKIEGLSRDRSLTTARNESLRAYRVSQRASFQANRDVIRGMRLVSARDGRVCPICLARDGMILGLDDDDPRHVCCRCALVPVGFFFDQTERETGEEWLRRQSIAFQKGKLGPARYELWSSGELSLQDMVTVQSNEIWGDSLRLKNLAELRK